jgi:hypothetical protein
MKKKKSNSEDKEPPEPKETGEPVRNPFKEGETVTFHMYSGGKKARKTTHSGTIMQFIGPDKDKAVIQLSGGMAYLVNVPVKQLNKERV